MNKQLEVDLVTDDFGDHALFVAEYSTTFNEYFAGDREQPEEPAFVEVNLTGIFMQHDKNRDVNLIEYLVGYIRDEIEEKVAAYENDNMEQAA